MSLNPPSETPAILPTAIPRWPIHRLTVDQYHRMLEVGILGSGEPVELLEGWLVEKMGKNPGHRMAVRLVLTALERLLVSGWYVDVEAPVTLTGSEPEPDLSVVRGDTRQYADRHPGPADVGLIVEVAQSSLGSDRGLKGSIYAAAGIPAYWIVNLVDRRIEAYTEPTGSGAEAAYGRRQDHGEAETIPVVLDGRDVARLVVRDVLP
ncbi:MAG: Uma2 family endonuclease [Planctomycetes bacterium]|nr:Uma2 family endonuclease [Planctomycetota bacterium]